MGIEVWVPIIVSFIGAITGTLSLLAGKRKREAEAEESESTAAKNIATAATSLLAPYQDTITTLAERLKESNVDLGMIQNQLEDIENQRYELEKLMRRQERQISSLKDEVVRLKKKVNRLREQIIGLGEVPVESEEIEEE